MSDSLQSISGKLNSIASLIPIIDKTDLAPLCQAYQILDELKSNQEMPKAFRSMAERGARLCTHVIMAETPFEPGVKKLGECVAKMGRAVDSMDNKVSGPVKNTPVSPNQAEESNETFIPLDDDELPPCKPMVLPPETSIPPSQTAPDDLRDLVIRFAPSLRLVLEDFEEAVLDMEKDNPSARGSVKRILHTWKGEFGVLDLPQYSGLIHSIEGALENNSATTDMLLQFKDILSGKIADFSQGNLPNLSPDEIALFSFATEGSVEGSKEANTSNTEKTSSSSEGMAPPIAEFKLETDPSLLADFITESRDHISSAETFLLELETDSSNMEHINSIFRSCHTVKGVAGFLSLADVSTLAHSMENVMDKARKGDLILLPVHIDLLLESMDCLKEMIRSIEASISGTPYTTPESMESVLRRLSNPFTLKAPEGKNLFPVSEKKLGEILKEECGIPDSAVENALQKQRLGDERKIGEILIEQNEASARIVGKALANQSAGRKVSGVEETIRVPVERLDQLIDAIGEAVIAQSMVSADPAILDIRNQGLERKLNQTAIIMRQIQELSMSLRMVSIKSTFQKMARLTRDLSKKGGKDVEFVSEGEETELDKSVVENISDPLIHMVRNSIDHGIEESSDDRVAAGKPPQAKVTLRAYHKAGSIFIEVEDDGRGLNKEAILAKAVKQGMCSESERFSDQEIFQFIFAPGFSTAKKITDVSGRGVGMDVVRRNIQSLRGSIDIQSETGVGTRFSIRLPLTLAIIDGMVVRLGTERYILPTLSIVESMKPEKGQVETVLNKGEMVQVRGNHLVLTRLAEVFGHSGGKTDATEGIVMIVEDTMGKQFGLLVDEIIGQQQVVIKNLGEGMERAPGISGGAIMSDGTVSLIIDIGGITKMANG